MSTLLHTIDAQDLDQPVLRDNCHIAHLESGQVIHLPNLSFKIDNPELFNPALCDTKRKNISYDYQTQKIGGMSKHPHRQHVQTMMHGFALYAKTLVDKVLADYQSNLRWGRTSYRPVEIKNRQRSKRQDDTRVHVDAFPSTPVQGWRILRVFCNINPDNKPRVWNLGEPFSNLLPQFAAELPPYHPFKAKVLHWFKLTRTLRTAYDHYMLHLHDQMKLQDAYQAQVNKTQINFPAQSSWIVFTDHVSHAALGGQYLLEQTFYLPVSAMLNPNCSPFKEMERYGLF